MATLKWPAEMYHHWGCSCRKGLLRPTVVFSGGEVPPGEIINYSRSHRKVENKAHFLVWPDSQFNFRQSFGQCKQFSIELAALTNQKKDICTSHWVSLCSCSCPRVHAGKTCAKAGWALLTALPTLPGHPLHCPGHRFTPQGCKEGGGRHRPVLWGSLSCSHLSWDLALSSIISISSWSLWYLVGPV